LVWNLQGLQLNGCLELRRPIIIQVLTFTHLWALHGLQIATLILDMTFCIQDWYPNNATPYPSHSAPNPDGQHYIYSPNPYHPQHLAPLYPQTTHFPPQILLNGRMISPTVPNTGGLRDDTPLMPPASKHAFMMCICTSLTSRVSRACCSLR
jgi:hypothetical protein